MNRDGGEEADPGDPVGSTACGDAGDETPRRRYELEETEFNEVPRKWRRFYRYWQGPGDVLAPNEALCPVCKVVIRSSRELRPGDRLYCMPCMSKLVVVMTESGGLEAQVVY